MALPGAARLLELLAELLDTPLQLLVLGQQPRHESLELLPTHPGIGPSIRGAALLPAWGPRTSAASAHRFRRRSAPILGRHGKQVPSVFPPISLVLASARDACVEGLSAFRSGDHWRWLDFFLQTVFQSTRAAEALVGDIAAFQASWRAEASEPRRDSATTALIARLPEQPIIDLGEATRLTGASRQATRLSIDRLERAGVLREVTGKQRLRRWEAVGLFAPLDSAEAEFATRPVPQLATSAP